jgi:alpha-1,6-mannosyltransferase
MKVARTPTPVLLVVTGSLSSCAVVTLVLTRAPLGSPVFFAAAGVTAVAYFLILTRVWHEPVAAPRLLLIAFAFSLAFRIPVAIAPVGADNDMVRYLWDGRLQRLGYNPYLVTPSDPALAHVHTAETRGMPSLRARTPYPPGAQLFFRAVVSIRESARAMKLALVACDVLTIVVIWRWLVVTGRNQWLVLGYAWNPLVILEIAHSGHIDALGALWIAAAAYWMACRRTALGSVAFVLAIATKLLPIVLAPLFWRRIRGRDAVVAGVVLAALYVPFMTGAALPLGAVPNVVAHIRFNAPVFPVVAAATTPQVAAAFAVLLGLAVAGWARWRLPITEPAAWAWPMAVSLACAPVIYPWYLLYFTPFLVSATTVPLMVWSVSVFPVYLIWSVPALRVPWVVPVSVMVFEYGATALALAWLLYPVRRTFVTAGLQR